MGSHKNTHIYNHCFVYNNVSPIKYHPAIWWYKEKQTTLIIHQKSSASDDMNFSLLDSLHCNICFLSAIDTSHRCISVCSLTSGFSSLRHWAWDMCFIKLTRHTWPSSYWEMMNFTAQKWLQPIVQTSQRQTQTTVLNYRPIHKKRK